MDAHGGLDPKGLMVVLNTAQPTRMEMSMSTEILLAH